MPGWAVVALNEYVDFQGFGEAAVPLEPSGDPDHNLNSLRQAREKEQTLWLYDGPLVEFYLDAKTRRWIRVDGAACHPDFSERHKPEPEVNICPKLDQLIEGFPDLVDAATIPALENTGFCESNPDVRAERPA